jgi:Holliday junction DNA helicase RuvA
MIGRLTGKVVAEETDGVIVIGVGGVGYEVLAPLGTLGRAERDSDRNVTLFVHTHAREDALTLFAFATAGDRIAFRTLIGVSNDGPRTAIAVLTALPSSELARAIAAKDLGKLTSISGIGKKTAERLLLELRDKLSLDPADAQTTIKPSARSKSSGKQADLLLNALTNMGYKPVEAERAIASLGARLDDAPIADLVKDALVLLAK